MHWRVLYLVFHLRFRMLSSPDTASGVLNINCCDPLGRSALLMAIDNENLEMVELLLENKVSKRVLIGFSSQNNFGRQTFNS